MCNPERIIDIRQEKGRCVVELDNKAEIFNPKVLRGG